jgi:endonuclease YncB( thermonuclease family)
MSLRQPAQLVLQNKTSRAIHMARVAGSNEVAHQDAMESTTIGSNVQAADALILDASVMDLAQSLIEAPEEIEKLFEVRNETVTSSFAPNTKVIRAIDGDTLVINWKGKEETVRLIGVDTPESVDPRTTVQCFGLEASEALKLKANGEPALFTIDPTQGERDKYNRLLGYVSLPDGTLINQWLIEEGYGFEYTYNLPYKYQSEFIKAEGRARQSQKGLWSPDTCNGERATDSGSPWQSVGADDRDCDSFATQKEAQDFFESHGGSTASDPHNLDRDHDGKACELLP